MPRTANILIRVAPEGKAAAHEAARATGQTLSAWLRGLMKAAVLEYRKAARANLMLPREQYCPGCTVKGYVRESCERCNRLQEELRQ